VLFSEEDLTRFLQVMLRTFDELNYRQEQRFHLELGLVKLVHLQRLLPVEEFLSQLPPGSVGGSAESGARTAAASSGTATQRTAPAPARTASVAPASDRAPAPAPVTPPRAPEPAKPAFSPFEEDRNRKITSEATQAPVAAHIAAPVTTLEVSAPVAAQTIAPEPRALTPLKATARAAAPATVGVAEPMVETKNGALALAAVAADPVPAASSDLASITEAVCAALEREGHNTAAVLLGNGNWTQQGDTIQVEVAIKKTMLGLTMNGEAEKICRNAMRAMGATQKLVWVPGENGGLGSARAAQPRAAASGSVQAAALENPLVRQAQELFKAEVRSVLDLRERN
jgi:DNA polymerase-3 subunit gamma/tau